MNNTLLNERLAPLLRRQRQIRTWRALALCWAGAAVVAIGFTLLRRKTGWESPLTLPGLVIATVVASGLVLRRWSRQVPDLRQLAQGIEQAHPELHGVLLTAVQQQAASGGRLSYLQERVVQEAMAQGQPGGWEDVVPVSHLRWTQAAHALALAVLLFVWLGLTGAGGKLAPALFAGPALTVTPGDVSLERGSSLVVLARFSGSVPAAADLVITPVGAVERRIPLTRSLADPLFGGSVPELAGDLTYRVEYGGQRSRDFKVTVFEFPRLERADAELTYPTYTGQPPKRIEDTRRVSAVEGTHVDFALQLNKPVSAARLVSKTNAPAIPLVVETNRAVALLKAFALTNSASFDLQLVDADGRTNKLPATFVLEALKNRPPELRLASPRGDVRPSALQEIPFTGTVWDDFGVPAYGFAYTVAGGETHFVELGTAVPGKEKRSFQHLLRLEELGVQPDELLSWYVWADDIGPDGKLRRTAGDLSFAEVRPFDEIFREGQGMEGGEGQGEPPAQSPSTKLAELQKQIINATWKLQREHDGAAAARYPADAEVVRESQAKALEQARKQEAGASDPRGEGLWKAVTKEMDQALTHLTEAAKSPAALPPAVASEQAAYQALLKLQAREYSVSRSRSRNGQQGGQQMNQRQLDQLELTQSENRYETQRQAKSPQSAEQHEQLQVMNRLQELARRQQDLNERLKELQTALQEARTESQREEARRQLKRLQEEQEQMLADVDELRQRMDRPENQSRMAEERQRLEQTRQDVQRAAEAAREGATGQALASGTRAQRELQDLRDDLRKKSSSQFADDLRELRNQARELSRQEEELGRKLAASEDPKRRTLSEAPEHRDLAEQLSRQRDLMTNLVDRATQVSQLAENAEPLLSQKLYDTLRQVDQEDAANLKRFQQELVERGQMTRSLNERLQQAAEQRSGRTLELASELLRQGNRTQGDKAEQRARAGIDKFKQGVEEAAESVLGDDTEELRRAAEQLDSVTEQLQREMARNGGAGSPEDAQSDEAKAGKGEGDGKKPGEGKSGQADSGQGKSDQAQSGKGGKSDRSASGEGKSDQAKSGEGKPGAAQGDAAGAEQAGSPKDSTNRGQAQAQAQAQGQGQGQGQAQGQGQGGGGQRSKQTAQAAPGQGGGGPPDGSPQQGPLTPADNERQNQRGRPNGNPQAGGGGGRSRANLDLNQIVGGGSEGGGAGPITGGEFAPWSDQLREVEELVDVPELRSEVAAARERARLMRLEFKRELKKPDWTVVKLEVIKPLVEVRQRIAEELARRGSKDALVPIDRDPVPNRYSELVRRYYEELGKDR